MSALVVVLEDAQALVASVLLPVLLLAFSRVTLERSTRSETRAFDAVRSYLAM